MVNQPIGNHELGIFWCGQISPWAPPLRSNDGSLPLVSCLFGGYKFASVLRCVGLVGFRGLDGKPTHRKSWAGNLLVWSDLTFDPSFKVNRG